MTVWGTEHKQVTLVLEIVPVFLSECEGHVGQSPQDCSPPTQNKAWGSIPFYFVSKIDHGWNILKSDPAVLGRQHSCWQEVFYLRQPSLPSTSPTPCPFLPPPSFFSPILGPFTLYLQQWSNQHLIFLSLCCFSKSYSYCNLSPTRHLKFYRALSNRMG